MMAPGYPPLIAVLAYLPFQSTPLDLQMAHHHDHLLHSHRNIKRRMKKSCPKNLKREFAFCAGDKKRWEWICILVKCQTITAMIYYSVSFSSSEGFMSIYSHYISVVIVILAVGFLLSLAFAYLNLFSYESVSDKVFNISIGKIAVIW